MAGAEYHPEMNPETIRLKDIGNQKSYGTIKGCECAAYHEQPYFVYKILTHETLPGIAIKHDTTVEAITQLNSHLGYMPNIYAGMTLKVPHRKYRPYPKKGEEGSEKEEEKTCGPDCDPNFREYLKTLDERIRQSKRKTQDLAQHRLRQAPNANSRIDMILFNARQGR